MGDIKVAAPPGFEPGRRDPESRGLPLADRAVKVVVEHVVDAIMADLTLPCLVDQGCGVIAMIVIWPLPGP